MVYRFYQNEIVEDYPVEAPPNLLAQTKLGSGVKAIAEKKLEKLGYRKIKFCGSKQLLCQVEDETLQQSSFDSSDDLSDKSKYNVAPHKRRAHLRKQRYGKELQSWKYVWIKETTIHKDKYQYSANGYRIYEVAPTLT
jgi:hypothetical protein